MSSTHEITFMKKFLEKFAKFDEDAGKFMRSKKAPFILWPVAIFIIYMIFFLFCYQQKMYQDIAFNSTASQTIFVILVIAFAVLVIGYYILLCVSKRLSTRKSVFLVFLLASALVLPFAMARVYNDDSFTHDYGVFNNGGHWAIIYDIYKTGQIPGVDMSNQYYQPKFYHAFVAFFIRFNSNFLPKFQGSLDIVPNVASSSHFNLYTLFDYTAFETARIFLALQGIVLLYFVYKTIVELKMNKRMSAIAAFIIFLTPVFWFISSYKNNDALATLLMFAALFAALRYKETHSYVSLVLTALCIGLGMETKLSAAMVAFPVALIFALELLKIFRKNHKWSKPTKKEFLPFFIQMVIFAVIVFPLGLGGAIYSKVKYNMPIGYVWDLVAAYGTDYFMYIDPKVYSTFSRVVMFPSPDLFWDMFNVRYAKVNGVLNPYGYIDFNCWTAFLKTGLWSESYLSKTSAFGPMMNDNPLMWPAMGLMYMTAIIIGLIFVIGSIYFIVKRIISIIKKEDQSDSTIFWIMAITFITSAISYMSFCLRYPVGCTMNARYGMLLYLPIAVVASAVIDKVLKATQKTKKQ